MAVTKTWGAPRATLLWALIGLGGGPAAGGGASAWAEAPAAAASPAPPSSPTLNVNEIRCVGELCDVGACTSQRAFTYAGSTSSTLRVVPRIVSGEAHGFSLFAIRPGSAAAQLGLHNGDVAVSVNGKVLDSEQTALLLFLEAKAAPGLTLGFERAGKPFQRQLRFDRRPLTEAQCPTLPAPPLPGPSGPATSSAPTPAATDQEALRDIAKGISCKATRCTLDGRTFDGLLDHQLLARSGRIVPLLRDGKVVGLRLTGVRADSLLALLGLKNGDVLQIINNYSITTPETALEAYSKVRSAAELRLVIERQGAPMTLTYVIKR